MHLKHSDRKIHAVRYIPPDQSAIGEALFFFDREENGKPLIRPQGRQVVFRSRISKRAKLEKTFELKRMTVGQELAV